mgnify:FL=1
MKKVYVIFECDNQRSYSSYCIKMLTCNLREALKHFKENKQHYEDGDWFYNVGSYEPTGNETSKTDCLKE